MQSNDSASVAASRRSFIRSVCAGVGASAIVGRAAAGGSESEYRTVVDVGDAGADRSGTESVSPVLQDVIDSETLLKFPPGRYYMDEQVRASGVENLGLVGDDATLLPANYADFDGPQYRLFRLGTYYDPGRDLHIENFDIDQRATDTGIRAFHASVADGLTVRNIDVIGRHDSGTWGPALFRVTDPGGSGRVEGFRMPDGAGWQTETPGDLWRGPTGILVNAHEGTLELVNCVVRNFPDNGVYVTGTGEVSVAGGRFVNNGPVNLRIGADDATVAGADFVVDSNPPAYAAQTPIRVDYADVVEIRDVSIDLPDPNGDALKIKDGVDRARIENTTIDIGPVPACGVVVEPDTGPVSIVGVDIDVDCSANAIRILGDAGGAAVVQGGRIAGGASGETMRHAIRCERNGCEFRDVTMDQWGTNKRRGLALLGQDYTVYQCRVRTNDRPLTAFGDDIWVEDCYLDSYSGDESVLIGDTARSVRIKNNELPDGIRDAGGTDVVVTGTTY